MIVTRRAAVALLALVLSGVVLVDARAALLETGAAHFSFLRHQGNASRAITVWTYRPKDLAPYAQVLFVMHGMQRDGQRYRNEWQSHAEHFKALLLVPEFSTDQFPGRLSYNLGNAGSSQTGFVTLFESTFMAIEQIFDHAIKMTGIRSGTYRIYGHSAGAQFVHRLIIFNPAARAEILVAANAGWYTMPDFDSNFPYGLKGTAVSTEDLKLSFSKKLIIALGEADTDPNHRSLNRSAAAMRQGRHRLERGHYFYQGGVRAAARLDTPFHWELKTVAGAAHQNSAMSRALAPLLLK